MSPSINHRENREAAAEIKFLLAWSQAEAVRGWARQHLAPDPHASDTSGDGYAITSLYLDTSLFDVFYRRNSFGRSKFRVRRYGIGPALFLERKLKTRGLVSKRRTPIDPAELPILAQPKPPATWAGCWFADRLQLRRLHAVCQVSYQRTARVAMTPHGPVRLTLDTGLRASTVTDLRFLQDAPGTPLLPHHIILELKFRREAPALFKQLIEQFGLAAQPFSKYRLAAATLGLVPDQSLLAATSRPQPEAHCACLSS